MRLVRIVFLLKGICKSFKYFAIKTFFINIWDLRLYKLFSFVIIKMYV